MSSSDPAIRSQRLALLESYLNATPYPGIPNFPGASQSENQLPSLRSSEPQAPNAQKSPSNPPTLPSLNEFIKPIFHTSSSDSSPPFHSHSKSPTIPSNTPLPASLNNVQSRYSTSGNNNSNSHQYSLSDQNRTVPHRNTPSPQASQAPSLSILAQAVSHTPDHDYQRKDPLEHRFASSSSYSNTQYSHANNGNNVYSDESYRRMLSGYNNNNNNNSNTPAMGNSSNHMCQPSHHHSLQDSSQSYQNPNMHSHRFHTTTPTHQQHSGHHSSGNSSSSSNSSSSNSSSYSSSADSPGVYHTFDGGRRSSGVSIDPQIKERLEEKNALSSQAKIEDNINLMQMLLNTPGSLNPDTEAFTEHLLEIYNRFHNSESSRLLPAMLAPNQNLHNNSTTPMDATTEPRQTHINSSS